MIDLNTVATVVSAIGTIAVTVMIYRFTKTHAKLQLAQELRKAWMEIDEVAIGSSEGLKIQSEIFFGEYKGEESLKTWHALLAMNPIHAAWQLDQLGMAPKENLVATQALLSKMLQQKFVRELIFEKSIYGEDFKDWCRKLDVRGTTD